MPEPERSLSNGSDQADVRSSNIASSSSASSSRRSEYDDNPKITIGEIEETIGEIDESGDGTHSHVGVTNGQVGDNGWVERKGVTSDDTARKTELLRSDKNDSLIHREQTNEQEISTDADMHHSTEFSSTHAVEDPIDIVSDVHNSSSALDLTSTQGFGENRDLATANLDQYDQRSPILSDPFANSELLSITTHSAFFGEENGPLDNISNISQSSSNDSSFPELELTQPWELSNSSQSAETLIVQMTQKTQGELLNGAIEIALDALSSSTITHELPS